MEQLLTVRQLQELLRVDRVTIYRMLEAGALPGFKVGGQWRFSQGEIEAWLNSQRVDAGEPEDRAATCRCPAWSRFRASLPRRWA